MTPQHEWVSVEEAARRLGISVSTVRRRIEAGELVGEREVIGGSKERYRVRMNTNPPIHTGDAPETPHDAPAVAEGLLALVREMRQQGVSDAERIASLMRQIGAAEATAETLRERVTDLAQALAERQVELEELRDHLAEEAARLSAEAQRPWFKRLLGLS
jgi:excisionase family DNA binding protein